MNLSSKIFDGYSAQIVLEDSISNTGLEFERLGWDEYDNSLEIYGVAPETRIDSNVQTICRDAGFSKVYVNHTDGWETHYTFAENKSLPLDGWRVKYMHKHGGPQKILLEKKVNSWPSDWFKSGYAEVVTE